jgi:hypothetical protein
MKMFFVFLTVIAALVLVSVTYRFSREWLMVDRCLSDEHGSFDYSRMSCDLETNHPYIPYHVRHPRDKQTALIAGAFFAAFLSAYWFSRANRSNSD